MVNFLLDPGATVTAPEGEIEPPVPADAVIVKVVAVAACWLTVKVLPAIDTAADRDAVAVLAATEYPTVPGPVPLEPAVIVIQEALVDALHAQPAWAVTVTLPVAPEEPTDRLAGEIE